LKSQRRDAISLFIMCNHYRLDAPAAQVAFLFDTDVGLDPWAGGAVDSATFAPVIAGDRRRTMRPMLWGFPPPPTLARQAPDTPLINARNLESPFWIGTLRHTALRCLVPATAFLPWSGEAIARRRRWYSVPSQPVFAFAGIWRDTGEMHHFAILTTEPNALIKEGGRTAMPVILHAEDYDTWLQADWRIAQKLVSAFPTQLMAVSDQP
jgi:putative SOS response-associated peptidase YedK